MGQEVVQDLHHALEHLHHREDIMPWPVQPRPELAHQPEHGFLFRLLAGLVGVPLALAPVTHVGPLFLRVSVWHGRFLGLPGFALSLPPHARHAGS